MYREINPNTSSPSKNLLRQSTRAVLAMIDSTVRMNLIIQEQCLFLIKLNPSFHKHEFKYFLAYTYLLQE